MIELQLRPIRRARSRLRQVRDDRTGQGPAQAGVALVSTGRPRPGSRGRGPGTGGGGHRFPRVPDGGSRRCTRGCTPGSSPTCGSPATPPRWPNSRWNRSNWCLQLYPFRETVASGAGRDEVVDRSTSAVVMVRAGRRTTRTSRWSPTPDYTMLLPLRRRRFRPGPGRLAAPAFAHTAAYDTAVPGGAPGNWHGRAWPAYAGTAWSGRRCSGTGRTRTRPGVFTDPDATPGAGARRCTERGCPSTTTSTRRRARAAFDFDEPAVAIVKNTNLGIAGPG